MDQFLQRFQLRHAISSPKPWALNAFLPSLLFIAHRSWSNHMFRQKLLNIANVDAVFFICNLADHFFIFVCILTIVNYKIIAFTQNIS